MPLVLGLDGQSLANVEFATSGGAHPRVCRVLRIVEGGGRLLRYYFAEGGREVQVVLDGTLVPGRLRTTLSGAARRWQIELDAASEPAPEGSAAARQLFDVARASLRE